MESPDAHIIEEKETRGQGRSERGGIIKGAFDVAGNPGQQWSGYEMEKLEEALVCRESCQVWCQMFVNLSTCFARHWASPCGG